MKTFFCFLIISLNYALFCEAHSQKKRLYTEPLYEPWGVDAELTHPPKNPPPLPPQTLCVGMIHAFQRYISPIDGPRSSFYPTSSQYALEAIQIHGVLKGIALGCDRLMRENKDWWVYDTRSMHGIDRKLDSPPHLAD